MSTPTYNIAFGAILIFAGSILVGGESTLQVVSGAILIVAGGIFATNGWNARSQEAQKEAQKSGMIKSVAAELLFNSSAIIDSKFVETDEKKLSKFEIFPRMRITALEGAISSGLFLDEKDRLYFTRVVDLHTILDSFNLRLSFTEFQMVNNRGEITSYRTKLRDGKTRAGVMSKLAKFGQLLMSEYGVKDSDRFYETLEEDATSPRKPKDGPDA